MLIKLGLTCELEPAPAMAAHVSPPDEAIRQLELPDPENPGPLLVAHGVAHHVAPEDVAQAVLYWLTRYTANSAEAARNIRKLAARAPVIVVETVLPLFEAGSSGEATSFLCKLLSNCDSTAGTLCGRAVSLDASLLAAKVLVQHEPHFDARLARSLLHAGQMTQAARHRGLEILEKLGRGCRLIPILIQFLRDPDSRIRSKAALMFGQIVISPGMMERLMGDPDARVRANFVEGLWNRTTGECRAQFRRALADTDHRVAGNALIGLHRLGETGEIVNHLGKMARHPKASFRAAAAWVMGQTSEDRYASVLRHMLQDTDPLVRRNALRATRRINLTGAYHR